MLRAVPLLCLMTMGGCGVVGKVFAPPTDPGEVRIERVNKPDGTATTSIRATNDGNPKEGMSFTASESGVTLNSGGGSPLTQVDESTASLLTWIGAGFLLLGAGAFVASRHPMTMLLVPQGAAFVLLAIGGAMVAMPYIGPALRVLVGIAGVVVIAAFVLYYGRKLRWFESMTSADEQASLERKGDHGGAAALAFLRVGGGEKGKAMASVVKNGHGKPNVVQSNGG